MRDQDPAIHCYLGLDLGTSGLKATLLGAEGAVVAEAEAAYVVGGEEPGAAETDPADWESALRQVVAELAGSSGTGEPPRAIGVTGQMHGVVPMGATGEPIGRAVLWPDQRASVVLDRWRSLSADGRARLSNPLVAGMAGPILTQRTAAAAASRSGVPGGGIVSFRSPKDWLRSRLTADEVTERSDASATLLWDVVLDTWSDAAVALAGLVTTDLPTVVGSSDVVGRTRWPALTPVDPAAGVAERIAGVPVVAGGADTATALTALQAVPGVPRHAVVVNAGTGIQLLRTGVRAHPRPAPVTHLYADCDGGWYEMLAAQNGGLVLSWAQRALGLEWADLVDLAMRAPVGAAGAIFVPWLSGERGALASPEATGGLVGLTPRVGRAELARAALEGYAFTIRRSVELLAGAEVGEQAPLVLTGGGLRDPRVRELVVDVLGRPARYVALRSASAVGAAVLAARALDASVAVDAELVALRPRGEGRDALESAYARWLTAAE